MTNTPSQGGYAVPPSFQQAVKSSMANFGGFSVLRDARLDGFKQETTFTLMRAWVDLTEIMAWTAEHAPGSTVNLYLDHDQTISASLPVRARFGFTDPAEAVAFKLRWEGAE